MLCGCLMHSSPSEVAILAAWPASSLEQYGELSSDPPEDRPKSDCSLRMSGYLPSLQKEPKKSSRSMAQTMAPPKLFSLRKSTYGRREHLAPEIKWHLHNKQWSTGQQGDIREKNASGLKPCQYFFYERMWYALCEFKVWGLSQLHSCFLPPVNKFLLLLRFSYVRLCVNP